MQPFSVKTTSFCLNCLNVGTLFVSFDTSTGTSMNDQVQNDDGGQNPSSGGNSNLVTIRTLPY